MLMMLALLGAMEKTVQLTLMMLAFWGERWIHRFAADAHDAGLLGGRWIKRFAADAHDAGLVGRRWTKRFAADAHDAGLVGGDG